MVRWIPPISNSTESAGTAPEPRNCRDGPDDAIWWRRKGLLDPAAGRLRVTAVDVGQGDGFPDLPNGKVMVADGGPSTTSSENHLKVRGITWLDYAVLSHGH